MLSVSSVLLPLEIINCTGLPAGPVTVTLPPLPHLGPGQAKNGYSLKSETQRLLLVPASVRYHSEHFSPTVYLWENEMGPEKREKFVHPATL